MHALELAAEDVRNWCGDLTGAEMEAQPVGLPSVGFQLRHIAGSLDRLLTYAEGGELDEEQMAALAGELTAGTSRKEALAEFEKAVAEGMLRVRSLCGLDLEERRWVGRRRLPSSLGGLLVHVAEHTARHVGQVVTTAQVVRAGRGTGVS